MLKFAHAIGAMISAEVAGDGSLRKSAAKALGSSEWVYDEGLHKLGHRADFSSVERRPGYLYVRNRAISSRTNDNWDSWPAEEIATTRPGYGWQTFIGRPIFVEHANDNHRRTRGVNIAAALHRDHNPDGTPDTWVELLKEIDPVAFPKLAKGLLTGRINKTSMGADVGHSQCSKCGNVAYDVVSYCRHIPAGKGALFEELNQKTGRKESRRIVEICRDITFFEDTVIVSTPADPTAFIITADLEGTPKTAARERIVVRAAQERQAVATPGYSGPGHETLYRGLYFGKGSPEDVEAMHRDPVGYAKQTGPSRGMGIHWTPNIDVAYNFARGRNHDGEAEADPWDEHDPSQHHHGVVLEARVHNRHVLEPGSDEWHDYAGTEGIFDRGHGEEEHTVREFGKLHIHRIHALSEDDEGMHERHTPHTVNLHTTAALTEAAREITLPRRVDTLGKEICPVCGGENTFSGKRCSVCASPKPPANFMDPDTSVAQEVEDLIHPDDDNDGGINSDEAENGMDPDATAPEEDQSGPDLVCDNCGNEFTSAEQDEEEGDPYLAPASNTVPEEAQMADEDNELTAEQEQANYPPGEAQEDEEGLEQDEAEDEAGEEDTGYAEGDTCPVCGEGQLVPTAEVEGVEGEEDPDVPDGDTDEGPDAPEGDQGENEDPGGDTDEVPEDEDMQQSNPGQVGRDEEEDQESGPDEDEDEDEDEEPVRAPSSRRKGAAMTTRKTPARQARPKAAEEDVRITAINTVAKRTQEVRSEVTALKQERGQMLAAFKRQAALIQHQAAAMQAMSIRCEGLERQMVHMAKASGQEGPIVEIGKVAYRKMAAVLKVANPANPAQPVAEPGGEAPIVTEEQAMQPEVRADVTQLGATPNADVSADATIDPTQPYGTYADTPVGVNRVDVTAPTEGTQYQRPPQETIVPVDVRIGDPDNPVPAFPWTVGPVGSQPAPTPPGPSVGNPPIPVATAGLEKKRAFATIHLAKLQIQAGIATGDELEIAASLDASGMTNEAIQSEINVLAKVVNKTGASVADPDGPQRRLVPRTAAAAEGVRSVPSLSMTNVNAPRPAGASPSDDEFAFV